jgi:hydrogenase maturation protease
VLIATPQSVTDNPEQAVAPVLVLGVGNILLRDEGIGVRVVQELERTELPAGVEVFDGATAGFDLIDVIAGRRKIIVIDALDADYAPGTVVRLRPEELIAAERPGLSLHDLGLLEALAMAQQLGEAPDEVVIFGVQPQDLSCGLELSPIIRARVPELIDLVLTELKEADGRQDRGQSPPQSAVFSEAKEVVQPEEEAEERAGAS